MTDSPVSIGKWVCRMWESSIPQLRCKATTLQFDLDTGGYFYFLPLQPGLIGSNDGGCRAAAHVLVGDLSRASED